MGEIRLVRLDTAMSLTLNEQADFHRRLTSTRQVLRNLQWIQPEQLPPSPFNLKLLAPRREGLLVQLLGTLPIRLPRTIRFLSNLFH